MDQNHVQLFYLFLRQFSAPFMLTLSGQGVDPLRKGRHKVYVFLRHPRVNLRKLSLLYTKGFLSDGDICI